MRGQTPRHYSLPLRAGALSAAVCAAIVGFSARGFAQTPPPPASPPAAPPGVTPAAAPANANILQGLPVLRVDVSGNAHTDTRLILNQVRTQTGQPYSQALVDVDNKAIASLDRFISVHSEVTPIEDPQTHALRGVNVLFVVEERPLVAAVEVTGNRIFNDTQIREGLTARAGSGVDPFAFGQDRNFILDMYHKKGYAQASVDVDDDLLTKRNIVRYEIIEGPATHIDAIQIDGNVALSDSYIKWRIQTKTYFWIFRKGLIDEEKLQQDVAAIRDMYLKKGYLDARASYTLEYSPDKSKATVRFVVLEGTQYRIGKINVTGNTVFSRSELLGDTTRFGPGSVAERDKVEVLQRHVEDTYGHEGYISREVEISPAYTETPGIVDLNVTIREGEPFVVGRVIVRGNANIQDRVIRRQMRIYPDQTFDMVQVRKSIDRLKAVGIFKDVKVTPIVPPNNAEHVRDALVETSEGLTGKYSIGAGVSTNSGLVGQLSVEQQNFDITNFPHSFDEFIRGQSFKGAGQYFQILLEPGTEFQRYRVTFREPYLFDTPYSFSNDLFYFTRSRESWDERRIGDIVTLGRRFGDVWALSLAFRAEQVSITNPQDVFGDRVTQVHQPLFGPNGGVAFFNDTAQEILNEVGDHFLTSIKPAVVRDTTDSQTFPSSGTRTAFAIEQYGAFGGDIDITKLVFSFNSYHTLYTDLFDRKTVLAFRNEIGLIPVGKSPTFERFYLGGIGELRGFAFRGVSPRSGPLEDPIGGDFSWMSTAEVNFPVYEELLRGVVFVDVGTVERDITIDSVRSDLGAGIRLSLPFFGGLPVAVDVAYPMTKKSTDRTQLISVSLGVPF